MKSFNVMAFRLGSPTSVPVSSELLNFYQYVAQSVAGEECRFIDKAHPSTIPFDNSLILEGSTLIHPRFIEYVQAWGKRSDIVVVDLTNNFDHAIDRGGVLLNIAQAIQHAILELFDPAKPVLWAVLLPVLPPEADPMRQILTTYFDKGQVVIISDDGTTFPSVLKAEASPFLPAQYRLSLENVREDPRRRAEIKLIKRLGHFQRSGPGALDGGCMRYAYDGSLCMVELTELLKIKIAAEEFEEGTKPFLFYHCPESHWLEDMVVSVAIEMELNYLRVEDVAVNSVDLLHTDQVAFLVIPVLSSGQDLQKALKILTALDKPVTPKVLSILSTRSTNDEERLRLIKIDGIEIEAEYMLKVEQKEYPKGTCPMCEIGIPISDYESDEFTMLTTYDVWDMSDNAGWKAEEDVPPHRSPLGLVPDYPGMIEQHGAWLMSKVRERLEELPKGFPADPLVVCPDEKGSLVLTNYLTLALRVTVVRIPREIINIAREGRDSILSQVPAWNKSRPHWYIQLSTISTNDIVVMDEFNASGSTRTSLTTLLHYFGREPLCYFSLIDFDPVHSKGTIPSFSLYEFQAHGMEITV